jgi:erythromycin esterase
MSRTKHGTRRQGVACVCDGLTVRALALAPLAIVMLTGGGAACRNSAPDGRMVAALAAHSYPLATVAPGTDHSDLIPLRSWVGSARVVLLGEATHGTREFFQLKHRLLQFLVEELGFTDFAIEASFADTLVVDRYVRGGPGTAEEAVASMRMGVWATEEVVALVRWIRHHNDDPRHEKKVGVHGVDLQSAPAPAAHLLEFLERVDPDFATTARSRLVHFDTDVDVEFARYDPEDRRTARRRALESLVEQFGKARSRYLETANAEAVALAERALRTLAQGEALAGLSFWNAFQVRDRSMAENALALLDQRPDRKIVLWAHNFHVARAKVQGSEPWIVPFLRLALRKPRATAPETLGVHLGRALGDDLRVLGFALGSGTFGARDDTPGAARAWRSFSAGSAPAGSLDATLGRLGPAIAFVNLRTARLDRTAGPWLAGTRALRTAGATHRDGQHVPLALVENVPANFDGLVFVDQTTPTRRLGPIRPPSAPVVQPLPRNLGFEDSADGTEPAGWQTVVETSPVQPYRVRVSTAASRQGRTGAEISRPPALFRGGAFSLRQTFEAGPYRGRRLRLSAWVRALVSGFGNEAHLWLSVARRGGTEEQRNLLGQATTADHPITEASWRQVVLELNVPRNADHVQVQFLLGGAGQAFIDDVHIEVL